MDEVQVSNKMWLELNSMPFYSRKSINLFNLTIMFRAQGKDAAPAQAGSESKLLREEEEEIRGLLRLAAAGAGGDAGRHDRRLGRSEGGGNDRHVKQQAAGINAEAQQNEARVLRAEMKRQESEVVLF